MLLTGPLQSPGPASQPLHRKDCLGLYRCFQPAEIVVNPKKQALFLENEAQITEKKLRNDVFMSKQVRLLKISSAILQGITKIGPKSDTGPICTKASFILRKM